MQEEWKEIDGWPDYLVSNLGQVWSKKRDRLLKSRGDRYNYPTVVLTGSTGVSGYRTIPVHRLVALAFVDGYFEGAYVNHIDGYRNNNAASNLEWVTHQENMKHARDTGLFAVRHKPRQWTEEEWAELHPEWPS